MYARPWVTVHWHWPLILIMTCQRISWTFVEPCASKGLRCGVSPSHNDCKRSTWEAQHHRVPTAGPASRWTRLNLGHWLVDYQHSQHSHPSLPAMPHKFLAMLSTSLKPAESLWFCSAAIFYLHLWLFGDLRRPQIRGRLSLVARCCLRLDLAHCHGMPANFPKPNSIWSLKDLKAKSAIGSWDPTYWNIVHIASQGLRFPGYHLGNLAPGGSRFPSWRWSFWPYWWTFSRFSRFSRVKRSQEPEAAGWTHAACCIAQVACW